MRLMIALCVFASPLAAWEFSPTPICTLDHQGAEGQLTITYEPALPQYRLTITLADQTWPAAPVFGMAFAGGREIRIQTDRHTLSDDGQSLTVIDSGFGNVLDGLAFNSRAYAVLGEQMVAFSLVGIASPLTEFRACPAVGLS